MKVRELIAKLERFDGEADVICGENQSATGYGSDFAYHIESVSELNWMPFRGNASTAVVITFDDQMGTVDYPYEEEELV